MAQKHVGKETYEGDGISTQPDSIWDEIGRGKDFIVDPLDRNSWLKSVKIPAWNRSISPSQNLLVPVFMLVLAVSCLGKHFASEPIHHGGPGLINAHRGGGQKAPPAPLISMLLEVHGAFTGFTLHGAPRVFREKQISIW